MLLNLAGLLSCCCDSGIDVPGAGVGLMWPVTVATESELQVVYWQGVLLFVAQPAVVVSNSQGSSRGAGITSSSMHML